MPARDTYLLHFYRSRSVNGRQWAARLDHLADGEIRRFTDPEVLLLFLQVLVKSSGLPDLSEDPETNANSFLPPE